MKPRNCRFHSDLYLESSARSIQGVSSGEKPDRYGTDSRARLERALLTTRRNVRGQRVVRLKISNSSGKSRKSEEYNHRRVTENLSEKLSKFQGTPLAVHGGEVAAPSVGNARDPVADGSRPLARDGAGGEKIVRPPRRSCSPDTFSIFESLDSSLVLEIPRVLVGGRGSRKTAEPFPGNLR